MYSCTGSCPSCILNDLGPKVVIISCVNFSCQFLIVLFLFPFSVTSLEIKRSSLSCNDSFFSFSVHEPVLLYFLSPVRSMKRGSVPSHFQQRGKSGSCRSWDGATCFVSWAWSIILVHVAVVSTSVFALWLSSFCVTSLLACPLWLIVTISLISTVLSSSPQLHLGSNVVGYFWVEHCLVCLFECLTISLLLSPLFPPGYFCDLANHWFLPFEILILSKSAWFAHAVFSPSISVNALRVWTFLK